MQGIKRIHVEFGKKRTTVSMDETLFNLLDNRLPDNYLSVRAWAQAQVKQMYDDKIINDKDKSTSVSRRLQALAIKIIASPCPNRKNVILKDGSIVSATEIDFTPDRGVALAGEGSAGG